MRKILFSILLLCLCLPSNAQFGRKKKIKELETRNAALQVRIDSLFRVVDSLRQAEQILLAQTEEFRGARTVPGVDPQEYTLERSDSLMGEWYRRYYDQEFEKYRDFDAETARFTSDVSDEVMLKRLSDMHAYVTIPFNETVKNFIILYSEKMPRHLSRMMGRSLYYFPIFEEAFARYDLPLELKYMSIIESALDPIARSRAGALGIWQFMYSTGKHYGLRINSFMDERMDVTKAADAAARYLRDAYNVFGDWSLAISAYNCGSGNVMKAIKRAGDKRDFWSIYPYLPEETRSYMPAFVGAMYAFTYSKEYGITPADVGMPVAVDTFEIRRNLHFRQIEDVVGVPLETISLLNPQYTHEIIPGADGMCVLNLPYNYTKAFVAAEKDSLYTHRAAELLDPQIIKEIEIAPIKPKGGPRNAAASNSGARKGTGHTTTYKVVSGDYLGKIAQRYGCTVKQLKQWNNLKSDNIRVGQVLVVSKSQPAPSKNKKKK